MFQRLIAKIDSLGERIHPIAVLLHRKQFRKAKTDRGILFFSVVVMVAASAGYVFSGQIDAWLQTGEFRNMSRHMTRAFAFQFSFLFILMQTIIWFNYWSLQKLDPLLMALPMSNRQLDRGFYEIGLFGSLSVFSMFLPFVALASCMRLISFGSAFFGIWIWWLSCFTLGNILFTFSVTSTGRIFHRVILFLLLAVFFALLFSAWIGIFTLSVLSHAVAVYSPVWMEPLEPVCRIPVLLAAIVVYNAVSWRLFLYNTEDRISFRRKLTVSLFVYALATVPLLGLWLLMWFVTR